MMRNTPGAIALSLHDHPRRRVGRLFVAAVNGTVGHEGRNIVPHAIAWRLREAAWRQPPAIKVHPAAIRAQGTGGCRVLLVSQDLSASGAPQLLVEIARMLAEDGCAVTLLSPLDGALRPALTEGGATVIVDPGIRHATSPLLKALAEARAVDVVICNTVDTVAAIDGLAAHLPTIWYLHEVSLLRERLAADPRLAASFASPARVWSGSELSASIVRPVRPDVAIVPYGLDPIGDPVADALAPDPARPLRLSVFGSYETRKGQDLLVAAMRLLSPDIRRQLRLSMNGRVLEENFHAALTAATAGLPEVTVGDALDPAGYRAAVLVSDAVVVPSRDDTLPLVSLDALGAGRVLMCTATTGTSAYLTHGVDGFVADRPDAEALAAMLTEAVAARGRWRDIAEAGRSVFAQAFSRAAFAAVLREEIAALLEQRAA